MDNQPKYPVKNTPAFFVQAVLTFAIALFGMIVGLVFLGGQDPWMRAFLAMNTLMIVSSAFTLAKCVRDNAERGEVYQRLDQARVDRILSEHDPYRSPA